MSEFRFEDPPPIQKPGRTAGEATLKMVAILRANPGQWAVLRTVAVNGTANAQASAIKRGTPSCFAPAGAFEATTRKMDDGYRVYARYVGEAGR